MEIKQGKFISSLLVIFLEKGDEQYEKLKPAFDKHGWAFKHGNNIFFDVTTLKRKKINNVHTKLFIEAHETSHYIFKHTKTSKQNEAEADYGAIILCKAKKFNKSYKIGLEEFEDRNNITFKKFKEQNGDKLHKKLKFYI
jgi:hypothetical protein